MQISHIYFSPNGETKKISIYFHEKLGGSLVDFSNPSVRNTYDFDKIHELVILSLPVYSQNIPIPIRDIIKKLKTMFLIVNITYGGFSYGNTLRIVQRKLKNSILIGYSITPVGHIYLNQEKRIELSHYDSIINRVKMHAYKPVKSSIKIGHIFASLMEKQRTKYNYRLKVNLDLCISCNLCIEQCPTESITKTIDILDSCIRCGHCVRICPTHAIQAKQSFFLKQYLKNKQKTSVIIR